MTKRLKTPPRSPRTKVLIEDTLRLMHIAAQAEEFGDDCLVWTGATSQGGYPIMKIHGCGCLLVRRFVVARSGDAHGVTDIAPRQPVAVTCGEKLCVNPAHLKVTTIADIAQRAAKRGAFSSAARSAKIAATRRAAAGVKLTLQIAAEIRLSPESGPVLAERYGVHKSLINNIKRGVSWRDYSNPFAGLGAR